MSDDLNEPRRRPTVCTISSLFDDPPKYEDALVNSKPVSWHHETHLDKVELSKNSCGHRNGSTSGFLLPSCPSESASTCKQLQNNQLCAKHSVIDLNNLPPGPNETSCSAANIGMAQLALSIVRGFTTLEPMHHEQVNRGRSWDSYTNRGRINTQQNQTRKFSYCQLDVNKLIVTESPPNYHDLSISRQNSHELSDNTNEPSAGRS